MTTRPSVPRTASLAVAAVLAGALCLGATPTYAVPAVPAAAQRALIGTTVSADATSIPAEQAFTVTIGAQLGGSKPAPGTVRLTTDDGTIDQTRPVEGRTATFTVPPGSYDLNALYSGGASGSDTWLPSTSDIALTVARATMTHVSDIPAGQHLDRFARSAIGVTPVSSAPHLTPYGHYVLLAFDQDDRRVDLASGDFNGTGQLAWDTTAITERPGTYRLFLQTSVSEWFEAKDTLLGTIVVDPARIPTTTGIQAPNAPAPYGSGAVRVVGSLAPRVVEGSVDGTFQVLVDGRPTGPQVPVTSTDPVSIALPTLPPGTYSVKVAYSGGTSYAPDDSDSAQLVVTRAHTATSITSRSAQRGGTVTVQVGSTDSEAPASGPVTLREGGTVVATGTATNGTAVLRLPSTLTTGAHSFVASYDGSGTHVGSTSAETPVTVTAPTTPPPPPPVSPVASRVTGTVVRRGRSITGSLVLTSGRPVTGRVQVLDGRRVVRTIGLGAASRGRVSFTIRGAKPGRHVITVRYLGSPTVKATSRVFRVTVPRR